MNPIVIASANGHHHRNGGTETCVERAFRLMTQGADVLEAVVEGVTIVELDQDETSVGVGGLPAARGSGTKWDSSSRARGASTRTTCGARSPAAPSVRAARSAG